jgi:hypothetical protein
LLGQDKNKMVDGIWNWPAGRRALEKGNKRKTPTWPAWREEARKACSRAEEEDAGERVQVGQPSAGRRRSFADKEESMFIYR